MFRDRVELGTEWQDPEFLETLPRVATAFTLSEAEAWMLDLKLTIRR